MHRLPIDSLLMTENATTQAHNSSQLAYYAGPPKKTMTPADTPYVRRHLSEFLEQSGISKSDKVLEVGCGMGKFTLPLLKQGYNLTGLDISRVLLDQLMEYNTENHPIDLIEADILDIPHEHNEQFDHVIGFFTLHHFLDLEPYIAAMSRLVKPGGSVIFLEPNAFNPLYYIQITFSPTMSWEGDKGVAKMTTRHFKRAAGHSRLNKVSIHKYGFFPPFVVNTQIGRAFEALIEKLRIFRFFSAFQVVKMDKPS